MVTAVTDERIALAAREALRGSEVRIPIDQPITGGFLAELSLAFENLRFEAGWEGEIVIGTPSGGWVPKIEGALYVQLVLWLRAVGLGSAHPATFGFHPPGGVPRIPDASWISDATLRLFQELGEPGLSAGFSQISPDFVIEVRSRGQSVDDQRRKMEDWRDWGAALGLLVEPESQTVHIYRPGQPVAILERPETVSCEPEMPGLALDFSEIWALPWV